VITGYEHTTEESIGRPALLSPRQRQEFGNLFEPERRIASQRGCRYARLATSDYQAPEFYPKLGYTRYGALANCPPGETVSYFWKPLPLA